VQAMTADAFQTTQPVLGREVPACPSNEPYHRFRHRLPASTVDALHYVLAQKDPQRLRQFLAGRTANELMLMRVHVNAKMG
jgi:hypothetical protein